MKIALSTWVVLSLAAAVVAQTRDMEQVFADTSKLEREGQTTAAFLQYLGLPGGEYAAASLGRTDAKTFLALLRENPRRLASASGTLIEADLLLALGEREEAKRRFQQLATDAAAHGWNADDEYPVEPPNSGELSGRFDRAFPARSFASGPGSHRDNWLLRRLIALELWSEAVTEFTRLWTVHRIRTQPYVIADPLYGAAITASNQLFLVRPTGFDSLGLQFALDYAFFLKRQGNTNQALAVLGEPLRQMDLDANPNAPPRELLTNNVPDGYPLRREPHRRPGFGPGSVGVSRLEYIRLVHGEFKAVNQEAELVRELEQQVAGGENRARRILARVRLHQGQTDAALALELEYIQRGGFNESSVAYRRALVFEEFQKTAEAVAAFESSLSAPPAPVSAPDQSERVSEHPLLLSSVFFFPAARPAAGVALPRAEVQSRLSRLYAAMGRTDKVMELELARFDTTPALLESFEQVEQMARRFESAGQLSRFNEWAARMAAEAQSPNARAILAWHRHDYSTAQHQVAIAATNADYYGLRQWKDRFEKLGGEPWRGLLEAVVAANTNDAISRLELLDLRDQLDGAEVIQALELLLATNAQDAFARGKGAWNRTHFQNHLDLAYRLMRLYEKNGQLDKLRALGLQIARGEKPFGKYDENLYPSLGGNGLEEFGNACLALAVQHADQTAYQDDLATALKVSRWVGARAQLERRTRSADRSLPAASRVGTPRDASARAAGPAISSVPWANIPDEVQLIASCENVLCLAKDDDYVFAGHPWGVAVYDFRGQLVTRLALGEAVKALAAGHNEIWAGTPKGLFRLQHTRESWAVAHQPLDGDVPLPNRYSRSFGGPSDYWFDNCVYALAMDGEDLWIGLHRNVQRLNTRTLELRAFSFAELKITSWAGFDLLLVDGDFVWADSPHAGLRRFDKRTGSWDAPSSPIPGHVVNLIGLADGQVWGHAWVSETLRYRPCLIARDTLKVTPVPIEGHIRPELQMINGPITWFGRHQGRLVFGVDYPAFEYDPVVGKLRPLGVFGERPAISLEDEPSIGLTLPDGGRVFGQRTSQEPRYEYPHEDGPVMANLEDSAGGLFFVSRAGLTNRVSSLPHANTLPGDSVFNLLFDDADLWLCTSRGVVRLDLQRQVTERFSRADGLLANNVPGAAKLGGKFYFACGWDDSAGGLIMFDPATRVFTSFHRSDGMDTDKLESVTVSGANELQLTYATEYLRFDQGSYRRFPPGRFDPATRRFNSGGPPQRMEGAEANAPPKQPREPMPYLGGWILRRVERAGSMYLCGTRGLVVLRGNQAPPTFPQLRAHVTTDPREKLLAEARAYTISRPVSLDQLKALLTHTNSYIRANAVAAAMEPVLAGREEYASVLDECLADPEINVRTTAVWLLSRMKSDAAVAPLRKSLDDTDPCIRAVAALALASHDDPPPVAFFEDIIKTGNGFGNFPFGADSTIGVGADAVGAYAALSRHADREVFELCMKYPPPMNHTDVQALLPAFGESLRKHLEAAEVLLAAYDEDRAGFRQPFAQAVFQNAGRESLPVLHRALASKDRVIRSNAARGCGAIGDPSSIPFLLQSLDLESGLSRASIVWALGELKPRDAIPKLIELHLDARNAGQNQRGGQGLLAQQAFAATSSQYTALRDLEAIADEWDELKRSTPAHLLEPQQNEELLTPEHVLEAIRKIGPAAAQEFYRAIAGGRETRDRIEAAIGLAEGGDLEREKNFPILRNLDSDPTPVVRAAATVSLLLLGQPAADTTLHARLAGIDDSERSAIFQQLARLPHPLLEHFRKEIETVVTNDKEPAYLRDACRSLATQLAGASATNRSAR